VSGGDIAAAYRLETSHQPLFLKSGPPAYHALFKAEADGLNALAKAGVSVPDVLLLETIADRAVLVLAWCELNGPPDWERAGRMLAMLHNRPAGDRFGWPEDNFIGTTPQINTRIYEWPSFFLTHRLGYQRDRGAANGLPKAMLTKLDRLIERGGALFNEGGITPSLLHGDLWRGNIGFGLDGVPVLFDPAVYIGDAEADLAMSALFGGFGDRFYGAYRELRPKPAGHQQRHTLYNLYHLLNHFNLFGGGYLSGCQRSIDALLSEIA
jgi:fructosamine-3-kinase